MANPLDTTAAAERVTLVEFSWQTVPGVFDFARYAAYTDDITTDAVPGDLTPRVFTAIPTIDIKLPKTHGGLRETEARIAMSLEHPFTEIARGIPYPRNMRAKVMRLNPNDDDNTLDIVFYGPIFTMVNNHQGKPGLIELKCKDLIYKTRTNIGYPADTQCIHHFGEPLTCGVNLGPLKQPGITITAIQDFQVAVAGLPVNTREFKRWHRGYFLLDRTGGTALIRNYGEDGVEFILNKRLPAELINTETFTLVPGCNKTLTRCRFWQNELRFAGYGYGTPSYNPTYELE